MRYYIQDRTYCGDSVLWLYYKGFTINVENASTYNTREAIELEKNSKYKKWPVEVVASLAYLQVTVEALNKVKEES